MTAEDKAFEYEAIIADIQAIATEVKGYECYNKQQELSGSDQLYDETVFFRKADEVRELAAKLRALKGDDK